ncbi:MAG: hypothetical protein ACSLEW_12705 [Nocardioides sp.]
MSIAARLRRAPLRLTTGGFILNSGWEKFTSTDEDAAKAVHSLASGAYPQLARINPRTFQKAVGAGECALGAALVLPVVSPRVAGFGLMAFSGSLLGIYWRTPGMRVEGSIRPTHQGIGLAKDSWLFGAGAALLVDGTLESAGNIRKNQTPLSEEAKSAVAAGAASVAGAVGLAAGAVGTALHDAKDLAAQKAPIVAEKAADAGSVVADAAVGARQFVAEKAPIIAERASEAGSVVAGKASEAGSTIASAAADAASSTSGRTPSADEVSAAFEHAKDLAMARAGKAAGSVRDSDGVTALKSSWKSAKKDLDKRAKELRKSMR